MRGSAPAAAAAQRVVLTVLVALSAAVTSWLIGRGFATVSGNKMAPWILGRAAGVTSYLLLVLLVGMGLVLSHPWRSRFERPSTATRLRLHVSLAVFTTAFTTLHIVVLATDPWAGVGWKGAVLPLGATYRPVPVTLGVIGLYAGLLAGATASLAGRFAARVWWPIHKVAALALVLVWIHGVLAGSDTAALLWLYLLTGGLVVALAISRYTVRTPADLVAELTEAPTALVGPAHGPSHRVPGRDRR
jgi:hypothetical protein